MPYIPGPIHASCLLLIWRTVRGRFVNCDVYKTVPGAAGTRLQPGRVGHFPGSRWACEHTVDFIWLKLLHQFCTLIFSPCTWKGSEILDQMLQCLEHLPKPMPQLEVSHLAAFYKSEICKVLNFHTPCWRGFTWKLPSAGIWISSGLSGHGGSVCYVSPCGGVPHSRQPSGHAGAPTDGRWVIQLREGCQYFKNG